jgi:ParB family chromosome partitioning protein
VHGDIEMGHARALLSLTDDQQGKIAREIASSGLNVRQAEALVRKLTSSEGKAPQAKKVDSDTKQLENRLSANLGQPVEIKHTAKGKGKLVIKYSSLDELDGVLSRFGDLG